MANLPVSLKYPIEIKIKFQINYIFEMERKTLNWLQNLFNSD